MAWPRIKNSRSSAEPGIDPRDGVQATVTPAPDAEPPPGSGQNTGVSGTRHGVVQNPAASRQAPGGPRTGRTPARSATRMRGPASRPLASLARRAAAPPAVPVTPPVPPDRADEPEPLTGIVLPPVAPAPQQPARQPAGRPRAADGRRPGDGRQARGEEHGRATAGKRARPLERPRAPGAARERRPGPGQ